jgi:hypothetical protein
MLDAISHRLDTISIIMFTLTMLSKFKKERNKSNKEKLQFFSKMGQKNRRKN